MRGGLDLRHVRVRLPVGDVLGHGGGKDDRLLQDETDLCPEIFEPEFGSKNRGSRFNSVVFPAPLGPMMAADVPARSLKLTWRSAGRAGS